MFVALGASRAAGGRLDDALMFLDRAVVITRASGHPRVLADALIRQAAVLQAMARHEDAAGVIVDARATVQLCADPRATRPEVGRSRATRAHATKRRGIAQRT